MDTFIISTVGKAIYQKKIISKMKNYVTTEIHTPGVLSQIKW